MWEKLSGEESAPAARLTAKSGRRLCEVPKSFTTKGLTVRNRRWSWIVVVAVALATAGVATRAMAGPERSSYTACLKRAQSTFDTDQCVGAELKRLEPLLAAAYAELSAAGSDGAKH